MTKSFDGILIASDLDGTMVTSDYAIPQVNLDAVRYFCNEGGSFAVSTGRSFDSCKDFLQKIRPNVPCILLNGALIYDWKRDEILWESDMPHSMLKYVSDVREKFPSVGAEIFGMKEKFIFGMNDRLQEHLSISREHCQFCNNISEVHGSLLKALFVGESEDIAKVGRYAASFDHPEANFMLSSEQYLELMPMGVNKGTALIRLAEFLGIERHNVYGIGDYYNDIDLIRTAGTGVCVASSPEVIRREADMVVCDCEQGAVAMLISHISSKNNPL